MTRMNLAMAVVLAAAGVAVGCGGGNQQASAEGVEVTLTSEPDPPRMGENAFIVTVRENGEPITDATVAVEFFMAAMPSMNMAEMRNTIPLTHDSAGRYRGTGSVMMSGTWDVTVRVTRGGQEIAASRVPVTAH